MPKNSKHPCGVRIEKKIKNGQAELILFIKGRRVVASQKQTRLLACLHENQGHIVSYERLIQILGHNSVGKSQVHILQQYVLCLSKILAANKASGMIASVSRTGYALCEISAPQAHAKTNLPEGFYLKGNVPI